MTSACCDAGVKFYFKDGCRSQTETSYQVPRAEFDQVLLDHAAENGAEVREQTRVSGVRVFPRSGGVGGAIEIRRTRKNHGSLRDRCQRPAFGPRTIISRLKETYPHLQKISIFAHYEGVDLEEGRDASLTRQVRATRSLVLAYPLPNDRSSIGVVLDTALYKQARKIAGRVSRRVARRTAVPRSPHDPRPPRDPGLRECGFLLSTEPPHWRPLAARRRRGRTSSIRFSAAAFSLRSSPANNAPDILDVVLDHPRIGAAAFRTLRASAPPGDERLPSLRRCLVFEGIHRGFSLSPGRSADPAGRERAFSAATSAAASRSAGECRRFYFIVWLQRYLPLCPRRTLVAAGGNTRR